MHIERTTTYRKNSNSCFNIKIEGSTFDLSGDELVELAIKSSQLMAEMSLDADATEEPYLTNNTNHIKENLITVLLRNFDRIVRENGNKTVYTSKHIDHELFPHIEVDTLPKIDTPSTHEGRLFSISAGGNLGIFDDEELVIVPIGELINVDSLVTVVRLYQKNSPQVVSE